MFDECSCLVELSDFMIFVKNSKFVNNLCFVNL